MPNPNHQPPPIALASLSIRDFRGIERLDLDFRGPDDLPNRLVVIAGPNGCGKTAVLEAALMILDQGSLVKGPIDKRAIRRGQRSYFIEGFVFDSSQQPAESLQWVSSSQPGPDSPSISVPVWCLSSSRMTGTLASVDVGAGSSAQNSRELDQNRLRKIKQRLINAAAVEKFAGEGAKHVAFYSKTITAINEAWNVFDSFKDASFAVELTESNDADQGSIRFDLFYRQPGEPRLEVDFLSSGQLELLLFIAELAFQGDRVGIVFIDEPELHLDPHWHRPLIRSLMRLQPKAQFIVTTHSPEIFEGARSYERHFLVPPNDPRARLWQTKSPSSAGA